MFGMPTQEAFQSRKWLLLAVRLISQGLDTGVAITVMKQGWYFFYGKK
tara:strand:- start:1657 stop:1800 length:144 start_codon:yes stop_codon:yes gene_type:complete